MKTIINLIVTTLLGIILTIVVLFSMAFMLAMPNILDWIAGYIGSPMTWILFIGSVVLFIKWCVDHDNK